MRAQARKALKEAQEKLQEEVTAHKRTMEALTKHINTEAHAEQKILELREEAKKQQQWFEDHLASSTELAKQVEQYIEKSNCRDRGTPCEGSAALGRNETTIRGTGPGTHV